MSKIIGMVHFPPDEKFLEDRKYFTNMEIPELGIDWKYTIGCFSLKYNHHYWHNKGQEIEIGTMCVCGKEVYSGEDCSNE